MESAVQDIQNRLKRKSLFSSSEEQESFSPGWYTQDQTLAFRKEQDQWQWAFTV